MQYLRNIHKIDIISVGHGERHWSQGVAAALLSPAGGGAARPQAPAEEHLRLRHLQLGPQQQAEQLQSVGRRQDGGKQRVPEKRRPGKSEVESSEKS